MLSSSGQPTVVDGGANPASSALLTALKTSRPLRAYQPTEAPPAADVEALHSRIATCLSAAQGVATVETTTTVARLDQLATEAKAVLDAIQQLKGRTQGVATAGAKTTGDPTATAEAEVARFVAAHTKMTTATTKERYSVLRPPPTVTEEEVDRAVAALTAEERRSLEGEFELTCLGDFAWMSDADEPFAQASGAGPAAAPAQGAAVATAAVIPASVPGFTLTPQQGSVTSLLGRPISANALAGGAPAGAEGGVPGFTLEAMGSGSSSSYSGDDWDSSDEGPQRAAEPGACTVEVEYTMDRWAWEEQQHPRHLTVSTEAALSAAREDKGFVVPAFPSPAAPGNAASAADSGSTQSFGQFSRRVLQQAPRPTMEAVNEQLTATLAPPPSPPPLPVEQETTTPTPTPTTLAQTGPAAEQAESRRKARQQRREERRRTGFVRQRVREVLLANRVEARERDRIALGILAEAHRDVLTAAQTALPTVERLAVLLRESETLLSALDGIERAAVVERLADPAQFLLIPRLRTTCFNTTCNKPFSAVVPRETCRRCGQTYCPQCCKDRGLGPSVVCNGKSVSLGWEPLCRRCFSLCENSQRKVAAERKRRRLVRTNEGSALATPPTADTTRLPHTQPVSLYEKQAMPNVVFESDNDSEGEGRDEGGHTSADERGEPSTNETVNMANENPRDANTPSPSHPEDAALPHVEQLSVKEAVLFGAYCGETHQLSDGLPPFYVATNADETAAFWDVLTYRFSKLKGTLYARYQAAGLAAQRVVTQAALLATHNVNTLMPRRLLGPGPIAPPLPSPPSSNGAAEAK